MAITRWQVLSPIDNSAAIYKQNIQVSKVRSFRFNVDVNLNHKNHRKCKARGCDRIVSLGRQADGNRLYCARHTRSNYVCLVGKKCEAQGCDKVDAGAGSCKAIARLCCVKDAQPNARKHVDTRHQSHHQPPSK